MRQPAPLGVVLTVMVGLQFVVPGAMLLSPRMSAFGWQMFAERVSVVSVDALDDDGATVALATWTARMRPEVRWEEVGLRHVCGLDEVAAVRVTYSDETVEETPCPPSL